MQGGDPGGRGRSLDPKEINTKRAYCSGFRPNE